MTSLKTVQLVRNGILVSLLGVMHLFGLVFYIDGLTFVLIYSLNNSNKLTTTTKATLLVTILLNFMTRPNLGNLLMYTLPLLLGFILVLILPKLNEYILSLLLAILLTIGMIINLKYIYFNNLSLNAVIVIGTSHYCIAIATSKSSKQLREWIHRASSVCTSNTHIY